MDLSSIAEFKANSDRNDSIEAPPFLVTKDHMLRSGPGLPTAWERENATAPAQKLIKVTDQFIFKTEKLKPHLEERLK